MKLIRTLTLITLAATLCGNAVADDDDDEHYMRPWGMRAMPGVAPVVWKPYFDECGSCHMAYQPGLLPAISWERIMATLDDHFGENAEMDEATRTAILNYLLNNAAGRNDYRLSNRLVYGLRQAPLRITELPYFRHEHREIPPGLVRNNPRVRSLSNCDACHRDARRGIFSEHQVYIPGYGRYEDD